VKEFASSFVQLFSFGERLGSPQQEMTHGSALRLIVRVTDRLNWTKWLEYFPGSLTSEQGITFGGGSIHKGGQ
jgi:hypothetical protein